MASVRIDNHTGKVYTWHNIPADKKGHLTAVETSKGFFKIMAENHSHPEDSWYNGRFIGDRYAVFKWVKTGWETGFYQQVTPWYCYFGRAVSRMVKLSKVEVA